MTLATLLHLMNYHFITIIIYYPETLDKRSVGDDTYREHSALEISGHLAADRLVEAFVGNVLVLLEHLAKLLVALSTEDLIEL